MSVSVTLTVCRLPGGVGGVLALAGGAANRAVIAAVEIAAAVIAFIDSPPASLVVTSHYAAGDRGTRCRPRSRQCSNTSGNPNGSNSDASMNAVTAAIRAPSKVSTSITYEAN